MEQMSACSLEGLRICLEQVIVPPELMGYIYKYDTCGMCLLWQGVPAEDLIVLRNVKRPSKSLCSTAKMSRN